MIVAPSAPTATSCFKPPNRDPRPAARITRLGGESLTCGYATVSRYHCSTEIERSARSANSSSANAFTACSCATNANEGGIARIGRNFAQPYEVGEERRQRVVEALHEIVPGHAGGADVPAVGLGPGDVVGVDIDRGRVDERTQLRCGRSLDLLEHAQLLGALARLARRVGAEECFAEQLALVRVEQQPAVPRRSCAHDISPGVEPARRAERWRLNPIGCPTSTKLFVGSNSANSLTR